jgi:uncharacterized repeat protein (TIGR01451 family)
MNSTLKVNFLATEEKNKGKIYKTMHIFAMSVLIINMTMTAVFFATDEASAQEFIPETGSITVVKTAEGGEAVDFTFDTNFAPVFVLNGGGSKTFTDLTAGEFEIWESNIPDGWYSNGIDCGDATTRPNGGNGIIVTLVDTEDIICTFSNIHHDDDYGSLKVIKVAEGGEAVDFTFDSDFAPSFVLNGGASTTFSDLETGEYTIWESNIPDGWYSNGIDCGNATTRPNGGNGIIVTLVDTEDITCVFTNIKDDCDGGEIKITKSAGETNETFDFNGDFQFTLGSGGEYVAHNLSAGLYEIYEENLPANWSLDAIKCEAASTTRTSNGILIELEKEENAMCTFYNSYEEISRKTFCGDKVVQTPNDNGFDEECDGSAPSGYTCSNECTLEKVLTCEDTGTCGGGGGGGLLIPTDRGGSSASTPQEEQVVVKSEVGIPNLFIIKEVSPTQVNRGETGVEYVITVANNGTLSAYAVTMTDNLPDGLSYSDYDEAVRTWELGDIAPGESKATSFTVNVANDASFGSLVNTATAIAENNAEVSAEATIEVLEIKLLAETGFSWFEFILTAFSATALYTIGRRLNLETV